MLNQTLNKLSSIIDSQLDRYNYSLSRYMNDVTVDIRSSMDYDNYYGRFGYGFAKRQDQDLHQMAYTNVIKSCIDTLVSKISTNKARPYFSTINGSYKSKRIAKQAQKFFDQVYSDQKVYEKITQAYRDSCIFSTGYNSNIYSFTNNINTPEGGTHEDGVKTALTRVINSYARNKGFLKDKDEPLSGDDVREGLTMIISCKHPNPQFEGQTKTKLGNSEVKKIASDVVGTGLDRFLLEHPDEAKLIIEKCMTAARARVAAKKARELTRRKGGLELTNQWGKLTDCSSKDASISEIFIVEGDSAGGSAVGGRDSKTQAVLPLRGKILNVEKARLHRALSNEEIRSMITAFGTGIGDEFDISKLRYDKIIIMTDADVDGSHIRILLLTLF